MILTESCKRDQLIGFITNQLEIDEKLDFLFHLDSCTQCWEEIYNVRKSEHPHFYKTSGRKVKISEKELTRLDKLENEEEFEIA